MIEKILQHLGLRPMPAHSAPAAGRPLPYSLQRVSLPPTQLTMAPARSAAWGGAPWAPRPPEPIRLAELARLSP